MKNLNPLFLSMWGRYFFHEHPGHRDPSCARISRTETFAVADPESHAHSAFVDFIADSLDVTGRCKFFSLLPVPYLMYTTASIAAGAEHSAPLKVKYHRLQQWSQL